MAGISDSPVRPYRVILTRCEPGNEQRGETQAEVLICEAESGGCLFMSTVTQLCYN